MMYPFMTLNDDTEITHSEMKPDGRVKVYIETPDEKYCFKHAACWLPDYEWEEVYQYSNEKIKYFQDFLSSVAHIIMQLAREGGFEGGMNNTWDDIDEIEPDEFDLMLLEEIRNNPECHEFVSQEEALKELELD